MDFKYAVFDMDGTLIDTNKMWDVSERIAVGNYCGIDLVKGKYSNFLYNGLVEMIKYASDISGKEFRISDIIDDVYQKMEKNYNGGKIVPIDGSVEYLRYLKDRGIKIAIATATDFAWCAPCLEALGILDIIDIFISTSKVGKSKKHPDVFEKAMSLIGGNKENTIVFEDAAYALSTLYANGFRYAIVHDEMQSAIMDNDIKDKAEHYIHSYKELM